MSTHAVLRGLQNLPQNIGSDGIQGTATGPPVPANTLVADAEKIIRKRTTKIPTQPPVRNNPVLPLIQSRLW